jgi:glycosyltransferase involved in cell wall biosynthesis
VSKPHDADVLHLMFGGFGGQFSVVSELSGRFRALGLDSRACLYAPEPSFDAEPPEGAFDEVIRVVKRNRPDPRGAQEIGKVVARHKPRAVIMHIAQAAATIQRVRRRGETHATILVEHTPVELRRWPDEVRSFRALRAVDAVVFQSANELQQYRLRRIPVGPLRSARLIPNGIDLERFAPGATRRGDTAEVHIGMATRMASQKDFASLIRAVDRLRAHELPPFRVTLVGDGPDRPELEELTDRLQLRELITFAGRIGAEDVVGFLQSLDVFVHATFGESVGMALLEAYGVGLPILTTDVSGVNNMVRNGVDALMVPAGDPAPLAEELGRLIRHPELRRRLGKAARERALAVFGSELMARKYLEVLADVDPDGPWGTVR